jgi:ribonuclease P protein component
MVVLWRQTGADQARRAGFTVSRQVRGAVSKNRVKRRLRAAYRHVREAAPPRVSLVVIGRPGMLHAPMTTVTGDMRQAFVKIPGVR